MMRDCIKMPLFNVQMRVGALHPGAVVIGWVAQRLAEKGDLVSFELPQIHSGENEARSASAVTRS